MSTTTKTVEVFVCDLPHLGLPREAQRFWLTNVAGDKESIDICESHIAKLGLFGAKKLSDNGAKQPSDSRAKQKEVPKKKVVCAICGDKFVDDRGLGSHMKWRHTK